MADSSKLISKRREELLKQEDSILNEIEGKANDLTKKMDKTIKNTVLVTAGLLAGYAIYQLLSDDEPTKKKRARKSGNSRLTPLLALATQKGLALLIDTIKSDLKK